MSNSLMPFDLASDHAHKGDISKCPVFRMIPKKLRNESKSKIHLQSYLHAVPVDKVGPPEYYESLNRSMGDMENPNLIYPVGNGIYIHIYPDPNDARDYYIPVEPGMTEDLALIMEQVEIRLVDYVHELDEATEDSQKRTELLLSSLGKVCTVTKNAAGRSLRTGKGKVMLTRSQMAAMRYRMVRDKEGLGPLDPLIRDPNIEDISCSGLGALFVEHKIFKSLKAAISFNSFDELDAFVIRLSEKIGKPVTFRDPIIDATLPDGSRINIVFGEDLSRRGSNFTIRKFASTPLSILQLVAFNALSYDMAAYLSLMLHHGMNMFRLRGDCVGQDHPAERLDHIYRSGSQDSEYRRYPRAPGAPPKLDQGGDERQHQDRRRVGGGHVRPAKIGPAAAPQRDHHRRDTGRGGRHRFPGHADRPRLHGHFPCRHGGEADTAADG